MTQATITTYHVFGDGWDDWFNTLAEAQAVYDDACKGGMANVRLYQDTSEVDGDTVEENYLQGQGGFPL